jgi:hypothetical protein
MKKLQRERLTLATTLCLALGTTGCATGGAGGASGTNPAMVASSDPSIGRHQIYTMPLPQGIKVNRATFTPSGKVLISYTEGNEVGEHFTKLATLNPDGTGMHPFFAQEIPVIPGSGGINLMIFPDDRRIYTGDYVIECHQVLAECKNPQLLPVEFPPEAASDRDYMHKHWSEVIVSPDNKHVSWTAQFKNGRAMVFTGRLEKQGGGYRIADTRIVSTMDPFAPDPNHPDGVLPARIRGGEVKQFVEGGTAISLAANGNFYAWDTNLLHLDEERVEVITNTPGYTETVIFSPDERLGIVMTTRFSEQTDPAVLGLLPRPYSDSLNMGLGRFVYTYAVAGVRRSRPGNIGPALVDIKKSKTQDGYLGTNLNTDPNWVYQSPMSWHPNGKMAMWQEGLRGAAAKAEGDRIQIVRLLDYEPAATVAVQPFSPSEAYSRSDLSVVKPYAEEGIDVDVKVYGRASGYLTYRRTPDYVIEKTYHNYSDDGRIIYSGSERMEGSLSGRSTYTSDVRVRGPKSGEMKLKVTFGPLRDGLPSRIIFDKDASGTPLSYGYAQYGSKRLEVASLVP